MSSLDGRGQTDLTLPVCPWQLERRLAVWVSQTPTVISPEGVSSRWSSWVRRVRESCWAYRIDMAARACATYLRPNNIKHGITVRLPVCPWHRSLLASDMTRELLAGIKDANKPILTRSSEQMTLIYILGECYSIWHRGRASGSHKSAPNQLMMELSTMVEIRLLRSSMLAQFPA